MLHKERFKADTGQFAENRRLSVLRPRFTTVGVQARSSAVSAWCRNTVETRKFDAIIACFILANSVTIGLEQSYRIGGNLEDIAWLAPLETVFVIVYIIELGMRFLAYGSAALKVAWVRFDLFLVIIALLFDWILPLFSFGASTSDGAFDMVLVFRSARLARLARALRLMVKFRELYMLVHSFMNSARTMCYTTLLLGLVLYIFSSVALEIITLKYKDYEEMPQGVAQVVDLYFPSLPVTMLTLVQFVCMDSIGSIYRPLVKHDWTLALYFIMVILAVSIVLMNIVTAILVNNAIDQSATDKEARTMTEEAIKANVVDELRKMLMRLDEDNSGTIDLRELEQTGPQDQALLTEIQAFVDPIDIFLALDILNSGSIEIAEFCDALYQCAFAKLPIELKRVDKQMTTFLHLYLADRKKTTKNAAESNNSLGRLASEIAELRALIVPHETDSPTASPNSRGPSKSPRNGSRKPTDKKKPTPLHLDSPKNADSRHTSRCNTDMSSISAKSPASLGKGSPFGNGLLWEAPSEAPDEKGGRSLPLIVPAWARELEKELRTMRREVRQLVDLCAAAVAGNNAPGMGISGGVGLGCGAGEGPPPKDRSGFSAGAVRAAALQAANAARMAAAAVPIDGRAAAADGSINRSQRHAATTQGWDLHGAAAAVVDVASRAAISSGMGGNSFAQRRQRHMTVNPTCVEAAPSIGAAPEKVIAPPPKQAAAETSEDDPCTATQPWGSSVRRITFLGLPSSPSVTPRSAENSNAGDRGEVTAVLTTEKERQKVTAVISAPSNMWNVS